MCTRPKENVRCSSCAVRQAPAQLLMHMASNMNSKVLHTCECVGWAAHGPARRAAWQQRSSLAIWRQLGELALRALLPSHCT
eukprot:1146330-Pelagomonas_calceolata.AAC.6